VTKKTFIPKDTINTLNKEIIKPNITYTVKSDLSAQGPIHISGLNQYLKSDLITINLGLNQILSD
jgi:hypothetical protein